jgi:hypothetical protein
MDWSSEADAAMAAGAQFGSVIYAEQGHQAVPMPDPEAQEKWEAHRKATEAERRRAMALDAACRMTSPSSNWQCTELIDRARSIETYLRGGL